MKITKTKEKKYIEDGGNHCPFCNSREMWYRSFNLVNYRHVQVDYECKDCTRCWCGWYELNGAEEKD